MSNVRIEIYTGKDAILERELHNPFTIRERPMDPADRIMERLLDELLPLVKEMLHPDKSGEGPHHDK